MLERDALMSAEAVASETAPAVLLRPPRRHL